MNLKLNHQHLSVSIQHLSVNNEYTEESKKHDLERLDAINPDDLLGQLKNFQKALLQIVKQVGRGDHAVITAYVTDEISRMRTLIHFFNYGLFDLLYNLFTAKDIGASHNWINLSSSARMPCITIALKAVEPKLSDVLFTIECAALRRGYTDDFIGLITTMSDEGFLTADNASAFITKINDGSISKDEIMNAIQWTPVFNNVPSPTLLGKESLKSDAIIMYPGAFFNQDSIVQGINQLSETEENSDQKNNAH